MSDRKLLLELMKAASPYLSRKKFTPRGECDRLNEVYKRCMEKVSGQSEDPSPARYRDHHG